MAYTHGKNAVFKLDDSGGVLRDLTVYTEEVSGLPGGRSYSPTPGFGDSGKKQIPGLADIQFSAKGSFDSTATTGPYAVINSLRTAAATATFEYGPEGSTSGKVRQTGECWLTDFKTDASVPNAVTWQADFYVDGVVTSNTFP